MVVRSDGRERFDLAARLFPICRSFTGDGNRETQKIIAERSPLAVHEVATGAPVAETSQRFV